MRFPLACILLFVAAYVAVSGTPANAIDIFVAPGGDDANAGTQDKPLATITKARDAVRQLIAAGLKSDVHVYLCAGVYRVRATSWWLPCRVSRKGIGTSGTCSSTGGGPSGHARRTQTPRTPTGS